MNQTDKVWINPYTQEREGPLNYLNTPEEVVVWEEMDALTWVIHNKWHETKNWMQQKLKLQSGHLWRIMEV